MLIERLPAQKYGLMTEFHIGQRVKRYRVECGLNQTELAQLVGLETSTAISLIESGKRRVSAVMLKRIADILQVDINVFYEGGTNERSVM